MPAETEHRAIKWTEKYRPKSLKGILGNNKAISELREWARSWEAGSPITRAVILYGSAGVGKTSAALALAREMDWDYVEMNASDIRTAGSIDSIAGPASKSGTFSGRRRLVVLDEADNLHGTADRGGAAAMLRLVRSTGQPVILIANEYYEIEKPLRDAAKGIQFRSIHTNTVAAALREICRSEEISCDPDALQLIAERAGGDLRSAINDLQAGAEGQSELKLEDVATAERDVKASIFKVLEIIFKGSDAVEAMQASYNLDESPEDLIHWIDENMPLVYEGRDLFMGYDRLSRADVFLGRVRKRQSYGLWRYATFLMTGGVQAAREKRRHGYIAFRPPGLWRRMGQSRRARGIRDSAAKKIAAKVHVSIAYARVELMDFVGQLLKDKRLAPKVAAELGLDAEEIALLIGSTSTTKKVQTIFEEAQRLREEERVADIEFSWRGSGQKVEEKTPETLRDTEAEAMEKAKPAATAVPKSEEPPQKPRRGRPPKSRKLNDDTKPDNDPSVMTVADNAGKRQKSLFEF
ncbi:MAG: replication factor C large subunit [Methanotrichaceae archaeon]